MTGQHIATSDSVASVTTECQLYANLMDTEAASWLDTVGWEDKKKEDMDSFRNDAIIPVLGYILLLNPKRNLFLQQCKTLINQCPTTKNAIAIE